MDESDDAMSVDGSEEESGGSSPVNWTGEAGNRRLKLQGKEDRISALPDSVIQRIISFLPSTKQAIQTGILSKRWHNQWSLVPILIFRLAGMNAENFSQFVDRTLTMHDCSKLKKFQIQYDCMLSCPFFNRNQVHCDPQLTSKLRFATRKHVQELILNLCPKVDYGGDYYVLPEFILSNDDLVKLELFKCSYHTHCRPNWPSLKELKLECSFLVDRVRAIENVASGCPLLESLELSRVSFCTNDAIASKYLKRLIIVDAKSGEDGKCIEISCPNLEEFSLSVSFDTDVDVSTLPDQTIEKVLSDCPLLHTLDLRDVNCSKRFVIASNSLKRLVLGELPQLLDIEILCPNLEESSLLQFEPSYDSEVSLDIKMLGQLQHMKLIEFGCPLLMIFTGVEVRGQSCPMLNCKCLTFRGSNFDELVPGIVCVIRSSPMLEKLVIEFEPDLNIKKFWSSKRTAFNCSMPHLKTVRLVGLSDDDKRKLVFNFVEFILKNSQVLENIVVTLAKCKPGFVFEVSKKLLGFQRRYPHITIELCCAP